MFPRRPSGFARRAALIIAAWTICLGVIFTGSFLTLTWSVETALFDRVLEGESAAFRSAEDHEAEIWVPSTPGVEGAADLGALVDRLPPGFDPGQSGTQVLRAEDGRTIRAIALEPELGPASRVVMMDTGSLLNHQHRTTRYLVYLGLAALLVILLTAAVSYIAGQQIASPVRGLSRLISRQATDSHPDQFAAGFGDGELGQVAAAFEANLAETRAALQREQTFNVGLSHELRTGLQTARQALELLRLPLSDTPRPDLLDRMERAIIGMQDASEAVLWLTRTDDATPIPITPVLAASVRSLQPTAKARSTLLTMTVEDEAELPIPAEVLTVLASNLLRNAILHSGSKTVRLTATKTGFQVQDLGRGLTAEQKQAFLAGGAIPEPAGAGLGLLLCRRLAERFGGRVTFRDRPDGGTCMDLTLDEAANAG
ncbi:ATP-binding protein [Maricaulis maris]|uniref:ATP-binding protein n=1 Tax=Maricaulis maris TaxID=74318 RepID=UPI003BAC71FB